MDEESGPPETAFRPVSGPGEAECARQFLLAQGWAGVAAGEHLARLARRGIGPEQVLWWLPGLAGEARAVALLHQGLLGVLLTSNDESAAARALLERQLPLLRQIVIPEGQLDTSGLEGFSYYRRELTVAPKIRVPELPLLATRAGGAGDAEQIHRVYQHVSWMSREGPEEWRRRIVEQPSWVAELDGEIVAVARWTMAFGSWLEVGGVATHPEFRRRGAATAVTVAAASAALAAGRQVVLRYGDPVLAPLYHPLGFEHVGRELVFQRRS
ncbi:MAG: GNAT family N-acetyltransferase [Candidatus Dormiibacterota bacterium]